MHEKADGGKCMFREKNMDCMIVQNLSEEKTTHSNNMEVVYVITGQAHVVIGNTLYKVHGSDIVLINPGVEHSVKCQEDTVLCVVSYSVQLLSGLFPQWRQHILVCNSVVKETHSLEKAKRIMKQIVGECIRKDRVSQCAKLSLLYKLLGYLLEDVHLADRDSEGISSDKTDVRMDQMYQYIDENYRGSISLSDLAEKLYISASTLSRHFKKKTGMYFAEYVNKVRMDYAVQELVYSDESITRIAVDSGFSNLSVFNRIFKDMYGMSPSQYRKREKKIVEEKEQDNEALLLRLREQFCDERKEKDVIRVEADTFKKEKYRKFWNQTINVGSLNTLLMANVQYHVVFLAKNLGVKYVRLWNIFSTQMKVTDGKHIGSYSYDQMDIVFDFLDRNNIIPFLDFGVRPSVVVKNENVNVYYGEECVEFETREAWERIIADFLKYVVKRYGREKVNEWIFELSYDIKNKGQCYKDDSYDFFNAYKYLYDAVKDTAPLAKVGGPMAIVHYSADSLRRFLKRSRENSCIPDFVSVLLFPYNTICDEDEMSYSRTADEECEIHEIEQMHKIMEELELPVRLYVSEWNNTLSSRNYLNDSCYRSAYFIEKLLEMWGRVDMISVWMASDWVSNYFDVGGVANGGNGLLTKDTICKPAYYALQFMNQLGGYLLARGKNYVITATEQHEYYIVCANFKRLEGQFMLKEDYIEYPEMVKTIYEDQVLAEFEIILFHMRADRYVVKRRTVNPKEGSFLREWGKFGFDTSLSSQDIRYIRQISFPRISMKKYDTQQGTLTLREKVDTEEVILIHIYEE